MYTKARKEIDINKLRRIEPTKIENKKLKVAAYCRVTGKNVWATYVIQKMLKNEKYKGCTMFQKTFTEDYLTGKRKVNHGERAKYYIEDTHPAIVLKDVFDRVQAEMKHRERIIRNNDGSIEVSKNKFNSKYILGNLLACGDCGASYRRRTERGKVLWRCATIIEKGKNECALFCAANINALLTKFKRPGISESQTKYSESLVIDTHEDILQKYDDKKIQYLICIMIGQTPPNYIVAKDSEEFIKESRGFQHGILNSLQICKKENRLDNKVLRIILDASEFDFSGGIYNIWGEASISVFLEYLLGIEYLRHNDTSKMVELCKQHSHVAANLFEMDLERFNLEQIFELMKIVNPFTDKLSSKRLVSAYSLFDINSLNEYQKNEIADFYLPFIICSKDMFPYEIVSFAVTNVHDRLSKLAYPEEKWEKLQRSLPPVTVFNQWDRCKRLRKAIKKKGYDIKLLNKYNDNELDIHLL